MRIYKPEKNNFVGGLTTGQPSLVGLSNSSSNPYILSSPIFVGDSLVRLILFPLYDMVSTQISKLGC